MLEIYLDEETPEKAHVRSQRIHKISFQLTIL